MPLIAGWCGGAAVTRVAIGGPGAEPLIPLLGPLRPVSLRLL